MCDLNLRPCPFCGVKPEVSHKWSDYQITVVVSCQNTDCPAIGATVAGSMRFMCGRRPDVRLAEQRAEDAWNGPEPEPVSDKAIVDAYELRAISSDNHDSKGGR